jgi:hypothetical protein
MWGLKCFGKYKGRIVLDRWLQNQVFERWIFLVDGHDELLHIQNGYVEMDVADAFTLLKCKYYFVLVFFNEVVIAIIIDDEWKGL